MLAIPVFRSRVAPVLDWCSKIIIIPKGGRDTESGRQIEIMEENIFELMQMLRKQGIETLICGALSPEMLNYGESIGLRIIHGIAGEIKEVLLAYHEGSLNQPQYRLPGCRGQRRCKSWQPHPGKGNNRNEVSGRGNPGGVLMGQIESISGRPGAKRRTGGPGDLCICPTCGSTMEHRRGVPCSQVRCPKCSSLMTRG